MAGLMLAACGSGSSGGGPAPQSSPPEATAAPPSASAPAGTGAVTVSLKSVQGVEDEALVGAGGKTVYLFEADKDGKPTCTGPCAQLWPPLTVSAAPAVTGGLDKTLLGTVKRPDGSTQVTYGGHPLYYYSGDSGPGSALGEGLKAFGGEWYVVSAKGAKIDNDDS
jgi:predicted lipoprotein with Yx(FWY)xxD motif